MTLSPSTQIPVELSDSRRRVVVVGLNTDAELDLIHQAEEHWSRYRSWLAWKAKWWGPSLENGHWNWGNKFDTRGEQHHRFAIVKHGNHTQGMMAVFKRPRPSKTCAGGVLYLDFLEVAPWNLQKLPFVRQIKGVGGTLFAAAVQISRVMGCEGRIGLHSLPQALGFYERMGMGVLFEDPDHQGLPYLEYNPDGLMPPVEKP